MRRAWLGLGLVLALLYGHHVMTAEWAYEDQRWIGASPQTWSAWTPRSLVSASWLLTSTPQHAHALSVVLHWGAIGLFGWLLRSVGLSTWAAIGGMSVLAVHPLTVEPVAYAAARTDLMAGIGILLAVCGAARAWWRPAGMALMLAGAAGAWASKETAVVLLALVPVTWWVQRHRRPAPATAIGYALVAVWLSGLMVAMVVLAGRTPAQIVNIGELPGGFVTWPNWLAIQSTAAVRLLGATVLPLPLTVDYDYDLVPMASRWLSVATLGAIGVIAIWQRQRRPLMTYGAAWTLIAILPRLIVQTPRGHLNEHQFYVPFMGCVIALTALWDEWRVRMAA